MDLFQEIERLVAQHGATWVGYVAVSLASVVAWIVFRWFVRLGQQALCFTRSRRRTLRAVERVITRDGAREGNGVWLTRPIHPPDNYKDLIGNLRVLAVANLKGGVGKTTLTANLGAYYAKEWGKTVLLVDLDYQGSLSSMALPDERQWVPTQDACSAATQLISKDIQPNQLATITKQVSLGQDAKGGRLDIVTAYYDLAQADNRLLIEWLLKCRQRTPTSWAKAAADLLIGKLFRTDDIRYSLAEVLHSRTVADTYDLVIIDCPPRLTTSEIQAFCAASHLLIPTIMDQPSAQAVTSLCRQIETLKSEGICPHLKYAGVVASKWRHELTAQRSALQKLGDAIAAEDLDVEILPEETFVPQTTQIVDNAADGIAYLVMEDTNLRQVRVAIEKLAERIASDIGLPRRN